MANPLTSLNMAAFDIDGGDLLALLKTASVSGDNDAADARGISDRYEFNLAVKQGQKVDFTVFQLNGSSVVDTNLDISLWSIGGTDFLGSVRGGAINISTSAKEGSSIASEYKYPVPTSTPIEITTDRMIFSTAITDDLLTGVQADFAVTVSIHFGGQTVTLPMMLQAGSVKMDRGEITMENVTLKGRGTPIAAGGSLMAKILTGTAAVGVTLDNGGTTYATDGGQYAIITRLNTRFADAAIIEMEGTLEVQGALTVTPD